jgi:hypothetical protein
MKHIKTISIFLIMLAFGTATWFLFDAIQTKYEEPMPKWFWIVLVLIFFALSYIKSTNRFLIAIIFTIVFVGLQVIILTNPSVYHFIYNLL